MDINLTHKLRDAMTNVPGGTDTVGHSSVQAWSAGDLFPAVIATVESYGADGALRHTSFELTLHGRAERFATYDDAAMVARWALASPANTAAWRRAPIAADACGVL